MEAPDAGESDQAKSASLASETRGGWRSPGYGYPDTPVTEKARKQGAPTKQAPPALYDAGASRPLGGKDPVGFWGLFGVGIAFLLAVFALVLISLQR